MICPKKYCREFHSENHIYQLEVDEHAPYFVLKLNDETLYADSFQYFADHAQLIKKYEDGLVYRWLVRVLSSIELDCKPFKDWTIFPE